MRSRNIWLTAAIFCAAFLAVGCGGSSEQPSAKPGTQAGGTASATPPKGKVKGKPEAASTPEAQAAVLEEQARTWRYDPTNKFDPFIAPPPPVDFNGPEGNQYDLDQMLLLGVIHGAGTMNGAYIRLPNGKDMIVQIGKIIGKHGGEVKEIGKDYVLVEEKYMDPQHPNDTFIIEKELKLKSTIKK
jgi:Tfp pilus assembly protein PilP